MKHWKLLALVVASVIAFVPLAAEATISRGSDLGAIRQKQTFKAREYDRGGETVLYQSSRLFLQSQKGSPRYGATTISSISSEYSRPRNNAYRKSRRSIFELFDPRPPYRRRSSEGTSVVVRSPEDGFPPDQPP